MKKTIVVCAVFIIVALCQAQGPVIDEASKLEGAGKFKEAGELLQAALADKHASRTEAENKTLEFEIDRLKRIKMDYSLTEDRLFSILQKGVQGITREEFQKWIQEGRFDSRPIDGTVYYVGTSRSNLFWRYPDAAARRISPPDESKFERAVWENCRAITEAAGKLHQPYVLPKHFNVVMKVKAKPNAAPEGQTIRAWLPIPRHFPFETDFRLASSSPTNPSIGAEESAIRSVYLEQTAVKDQPTEFRIEYTYTHHGIFFDLQADRIMPLDPRDPSVSQFIKEGPHVVFTDKIRRLSDQLVGKETNPLLNARNFYDWITSNIKYSYALEYSTIRNISDYCLTNMYGDCGQEALLFITLCRYNGIPARWQSGWFTFPGGKTIHDWAEIYLKPYGWIPVDPYMGIFAQRYLNSLGPDEKEQVRKFYFGGLDQYRMSANSDHSQSLNPPKRSMRSDNVDFQRGELEYGETNIYFDQYSFDLQVEEIPTTP